MRSKFAIKKFSSAKAESYERFSQRQLQQGELVRHALAEIFIQQPPQHEKLRGLLITISSVVMSPDLKNAKVYFVAQKKEQDKEVSKALNNSVPYLKKLLSGKLRSRFLPNLKFFPDNSFEIAEHIESILRKVQTKNL